MCCINSVEMLTVLSLAVLLSDMNQLVCFVVVVVVVAVVTAQGPPDRKQMEADIAACQTSEKPTQADITLFSNHQPQTSQAGKCFVGCIMTRRGFLVNGAFSRAAADDHAKRQIKDQAMLTNILKSNLACEKEVGTSTDKCVTGPKLVQCMEKNMPVRTVG